MNSEYLIPFRLSVFLVALSMLLLAPFAAAQGPVENFHAVLAGDNQQPPVDTRARGLATFQLSADGTKLEYKVLVANIQNVIGAHVHFAPSGQNGPIVLPLLGNPFIPDPGVTLNGILVEGTATAADVSGPLAGDLAALVSAMRSGETYVNIHTVAYRPGEIRGQIK